MGRIEGGIYYDSHGKPSHKGVVEVDGKYYYAGKNGVILTSQKKIVHHGMANGLVHHGRYRIDKNGEIDLSSLKAVKNKKRKKKNKNTSSNNDKKDRKIAKYAWLIVAVTSLVMIALILFVNFFGKGLFASTDPSGEPRDGSNFRMTLPDFTDEVYLCSPIMESYYKGEMTLEQVLAQKGELYSPLSFSYAFAGADSAELTISERADLSDGTVYEMNVRAEWMSIDNLKTGTTYYYKVSAVDRGGSRHEETGYFRTADTNRFITLPGVPNVRDIGGYDTLYNKKIKQGLLIRGAEPDGLVRPDYYLTDPEAAKPFGFVYDFDLRNSTIMTTEFVSRLGEDVGHKFYNAPQYGAIFATSSVPLLKDIFTDLADPSKYPMYMHCTHGVDRSGTIVFLLQGLLGVSEEDLRREYALSGEAYANSANLNPIFSGIASVKGDTINEKIERFMIDTVGITKEQIESLRDIFLG